jgi:transposase
MSTITIGVDLAKYVFSTCAVDASDRGLQRRDFKRDAFAAWLAQQPAGTVIAMEACSGAHDWVRRCREYGLIPRLMAAQFVRPFRKNPVASWGVVCPETSSYAWIEFRGRRQLTSPCVESD